MSSLHPYTDSIARQRQLAAGRRPRRRLASRGRLAVALAVAACAASGTAATVIGAGPSHVAAPQRLSAETSMPGLHTGATSASFARRIRTLERAGYVEVACRVDGDLMFNPHTRRYQLVRA
jgi:hypothetical protein